MDQALLRRACAQLDFDPDDDERVNALAAIAVTRMAWRDGPVEDWHSVRFRRIADGDMMRANAAATRLVRSVLVDHSRAQGDLFSQVSQVLTDPDRVLPDGRRLLDLAPNKQELSKYQAHVEACCKGWTDTVARNGAADVLTLLACRGSTFNWRWWLANGWPQVVRTFIQRIDDPALWQNAREMDNRRRIGDPPDGLTSTDLSRLLLTGPDHLSAAAATYCLRAGLSALLPQDCGLPPVQRHLLPPDYLRLVEQPAFDPRLIILS
ncbi:hypothetical protein [Micromonospora sp. NBC_01796]|uniref:hypothetical protein n=1 Tax=Micromonospora sp. NBC_01796 TaxID=2975987 RepID=UPI002DD92B35|nr:hypothetical protein [Micromonospora sp. NBC_01796]WSA83803.1 hypothetical protein OIE47_25955 [Micromonospora sp. NBC_01796]